MRCILSIILLLSICEVSFAQTHLSALYDKIRSADSVYIISHELTAGFIIKDKKGKSIKPPKLVIGDRINYKIVKEKFVLPDTAKNTLAAIILRPFEDKKMWQGKCYLPHHTIVLKKGNRLSYIELCFSCRRLLTSKDIIFSEDDIDNRKWIELESFFKQKGLKYELYDEEKPDEED